MLNETTSSMVNLDEDERYSLQFFCFLPVNSGSLLAPRLAGQVRLFVAMTREVSYT
jgi:hypothetical protein